MKTFSELLESLQMHPKLSPNATYEEKMEVSRRESAFLREVEVLNKKYVTDLRDLAKKYGVIGAKKEFFLNRLSSWL